MQGSRKRGEKGAVSEIERGQVQVQGDAGRQTERSLSITSTLNITLPKLVNC